MCPTSFLASSQGNQQACHLRDFENPCFSLFKLLWEFQEAGSGNGKKLGWWVGAGGSVTAATGHVGTEPGVDHSCSHSPSHLVSHHHHSCLVISNSHRYPRGHRLSSFSFFTKYHVHHLVISCYRGCHAL